MTDRIRTTLRSGVVVALVLAFAGAAPAAPERAQARGQEPVGPGPGVSRVIFDPITPEESERVIRSITLPPNLNQGVKPAGSGTSSTTLQSATRVAGDTAPTGPASIAELARALKHDPDLIYEYVHDNIAYYPIWGLQKGAVGAILDNQGTAFDQAALMVELLRESGYAASFIKGRVSVTAAQLHDWFGIDTSNGCAVKNFFTQARIPAASYVPSGAVSCSAPAALTGVKFNHIWVKTTIDGTAYYFDPSFKSHVYKPGIDLATVSGYSPSAYLSAARSGATITVNYVQGINRSAIRNNLTTYANNLANYLRTNLPTSSLDDVVGGKTLAPHTDGTLRQTTLPYQDTSVAITEWDSIPATYSPTLRIRYRGIDQTYTSDAIYGRRLTLTFNGSNQPVLKLDGTVLATGTATTPGTTASVTFNITHGAYASTFANQNFNQPIVAGGTYLIANGWGPVGRGAVERHRSALEASRAAGGTDGSEAVLGSSLAVLAATWLAEISHSDYLIDRLANTNTLFHHQVGIAGYYNAPYVDLPGITTSTVSQVADTAKERAVFYSEATHLSIFESAAVQQTAGVSAVSTAKLVDIASAAGDKIFDATSANYASAVAPNLISCSAWTNKFETAVGGGSRLILPTRCNITENSWSGVGYYVINGANTSIGSVIGGGLLGGSSSSTQTTSAFDRAAVDKAKPPKEWKQVGSKLVHDPIEFAKGHFLYAHEDMRVGAGEFPASLGINRLYSSGMRTNSGPLGKGWTHSLAVAAAAGTDGFQGMGEDSALDAVGTLVEQMVSLDLMGDAAKPADKMVIATLGQRWLGDQLIDNTVVVQQGLNGEVFVKLPDGSYNPPPGNPAKLTKNTDGTYRYETVNRNVLAFNSAGQLATFTHASGIQAKLTYSGGNLTQVQNSLGRTLTLTNTSGRITAASDGTRTVHYAYDTNGNLSTYTDATAKNTTYQYDLPGRMTKIFYPSNPMTAFVTNVYDTLGRVQTQTNAVGGLYTYYFAGSRSEEEDPNGAGHVSYFDALGNELKAIDALGHVILKTYDGQGRLARTELPEGNAVEYAYDDTTCAGTDQRCTHNVKTVRQVAKPGSGLATLESHFTYEAAFNKVASATDPRGKVTTFTYTAQGNPLTVTAPADAAGVQPQTTYGYTAFTPSGYPTFYLQTSETSKISATATVATTTAYNAANKYVPQSKVVDAGTGKLNLSTSYTFDAVGNLTQVNGPRTDVTDTTGYAYDAERRVTQVTDALGKVTQNGYDADGRLVRTAAQLGTQWLVSCRSYTVSGKPLKAWGPGVTAAATTCPTAAAPVAVTDYAYDTLDRLIRVTENLTTAEGGNRVTETTYNADGSVASVSRAVGTSLAQTYAAYTYTANGQVATVKDARNNLTTYEYDGLDRRAKLRYPHPTTANTSSTTDYEQYGFDAAGNLVSHRKRSGQTVTLAYDALDRLLSRSYPTTADNVAFAYDLLGRRTQAKYADNSFTVAYAWDAAGRLTSTTAGGKTLAYQYDPAGNRTRLTWPETAFYVTGTYDALNRPTAVKELGTTNLATYAYDDLSRRTTVTLGNGTTTTYGYSSQGALSSLAHNLAGTAQDLTYGYTRNQAQEITGQSWTNDLYQWAGYANGTKSYATNGLNRYTNVAGTAITYDTNGNLKGDGVWTYTFDADNKLKTAAKTGYAASLAYDPEARLRRTTLAGVVTDLVYDGTDLVAEYDGSGAVLRRYVHGPGVDEPLVWYEGSGTTTKTWLYADQQGSIVATANGAGTSTAIHTYGPFGEPNVATGVRFRYTGQQLLGDLNLYYYKARFYSPALGRFLQTDPIGTADDLNLYAYVGNNPVNATDPSGLSAAQGKLLFEKMSGGAPGFALGFVPGYDLVSAFRDPDASILDYGIGILGIIPGVGKEAGVGVKTLDNIIESVVRGGAKAAKEAAAVGRAGKQARLRELANDGKLGSADRGWIKQELNSIDRGQRSTIRNPPGKDLAHERGREAAKGYDYSHSNLQDRDLHRLQHKYDDFGRANAERPLP